MRVETIADQLFYSTVRIINTRIDGSTSCGTGFLFRTDDGPNAHRLLISNKHVLEKASKIYININQGCEAPDDVPCTIEIPTAVFEHPDASVDVALIDIDEVFISYSLNVAPLFARFLSPQHIPSQDQIERLNSIEDLTIVGYPNALWDEKHCLPIVRRGISATPVMVDYQNKPTFLIDASIFPGSSGSPVFLYNEGLYTQGNSVNVGSRIYLLGIVAAVNYIRSSLHSNTGPDSYINQFIDLGTVFKARTIMETVEAYRTTLKNS